jgi:hypothetical protein
MGHIVSLDQNSEQDKLGSDPFADLYRVTSVQESAARYIKMTRVKLI